MSDSDGLDSTKYRSSRRQPQQTQHLETVKCPRCESTNTKFCYYNNYNKTQPRHFCKACKRYWTKGGTLHNVPIGGGRKNKRLRCPNNTSATATATMDISNNTSIDQDSLDLPGLSDSKDTSDVAKDSFFKPSGSEKSDDVESYTDIEELKDLVSWDFYGNFIGCTMQQLAQDDHPRLGFSSSFETTPSSDFIETLENDHESPTITTESMIMPSNYSQEWQIPITSNFLELNNRNWNELDTMVLEDLNKPWEDPTFKT